MIAQMGNLLRLAVEDLRGRSLESRMAEALKAYQQAVAIQQPLARRTRPARSSRRIWPAITKGSATCCRRRSPPNA